MSVSKIPEGYGSITPYLTVQDLPAQLDFLERAFGAVVTERIETPARGLRHAELLIGDSRMMLGQAQPDWPASSATFYHYVEDVDAVFARAVEAGAEIVMPLRDEPYGDRAGGVRDPQGTQWWIATHIEDVGPEETARRMAELDAKAD